ncbi:hypothetical protein TGARI_226990 [Toxoplasma gondii ARI]|uniref:Uncharacterized protein n=1 Tax=Toxoplasma gondii ARI TaxID=1074872 RepID=A0A139XX60_TOXGO|nr:hypothetical protein TGARI_226990 [Toxoplasma gondii ARI]
MAWAPGPQRPGGVPPAHRYVAAGPGQQSVQMKNPRSSVAGHREFVDVLRSPHRGTVSQMHPLSPALSPRNSASQGQQSLLNVAPGIVVSGQLPARSAAGHAVGFPSVRTPRHQNSMNLGLEHTITIQGMHDRQASAMSGPSSWQAAPGRPPHAAAWFPPPSTRPSPSVDTASLEQLKMMKLQLLEEQKCHQEKLAGLNREALELQQSLRSQQATVLELQQRLVSQQRAFEEELVALRLSAPLTFVSPSAQGTYETRDLKALRDVGVEETTDPHRPSTGGENPSDSTLLARKRQLQEAEAALTATQERLEATRRMLHNAIEEEESGSEKRRSSPERERKRDDAARSNKIASDEAASSQKPPDRVEGASRQLRVASATKQEEAGRDEGKNNLKSISSQNLVVSKALSGQTPMANSVLSSEDSVKKSNGLSQGRMGAETASVSKDPSSTLTFGGSSPVIVRSPSPRESLRKSTQNPTPQNVDKVTTSKVTPALKESRTFGLSKGSPLEGGKAPGSPRSLDVPAAGRATPKVNICAAPEMSTSSYIGKLLKGADSGTKTSSVIPPSQGSGKVNSSRVLGQSDGAGVSVLKPSTQATTHLQVPSSLTRRSMLLPCSAGTSRAPAGKGEKEQTSRPATDKGMSNAGNKHPAGTVPKAVATQHLKAGETTLLVPSHTRIIVPR